MCSNASQLCHNQTPFNSYFWNNCKNESPRQVLKTRISLIPFCNSEVLSLLPHFYIICSIVLELLTISLLELLIISCARLSCTFVCKGLSFLVGYIKTISWTWRSIVPYSVSKIIAEVSQIDLLDRISFLNMVTFIVPEVRSFNDSNSLNSVFRHRFFESSELEVFLSAALFLRVSILIEMQCKSRHCL